MADLRPYIYHEVQDRNGSMLCAQHCLNNLLQQHLYSEFDLADLAANLDAKENAELDTSDRAQTSQNMDDTGFFSLSVLEDALQVFDLTLVRWRGEAMRECHEHPENQTAFVLNLQSHWLPLRRFSTSSRWYNLNSFLRQPEWISPTYLQMVLAEAENEGYSVFVVRRLSAVEGRGEADGASQMGPEDGMGVLPDCEADLIALELGDPTGRAGVGMDEMLNIVTTNPTFDHDSYASAARSARPQASGSRSAFPQDPPQASSSSSSFDELDPVAASLARSKADLARFQQAQSSALFESQAYNPPQPRRRRQGDVPDIFGGTGQEEEQLEQEGVYSGVPPAQPLNRFQRQQMEEEEMMKRAIEESLRDARARGEAVHEDDGDENQAQAGSGSGTPAVQARGVSAGQISRPRSAPPMQAPGTASIDVDAEDEELDVDDLGGQGQPAEPVYDFMAQSRFYDDDDAALQAALSASLAEGVPEGWAPPPPRTAAVPASERRASESAQAAVMLSTLISGVPAMAAESPNPSRTDAAGIAQTEAEGGEDEDEEDEEPAQVVLSPEELRRKRLERFK